MSPLFVACLLLVLSSFAAANPQVSLQLYGVNTNCNSSTPVIASAQDTNSIYLDGIYTSHCLAVSSSFGAGIQSSTFQCSGYQTVVYFYSDTACATQVSTYTNSGGSGSCAALPGSVGDVTVSCTGSVPRSSTGPGGDIINTGIPGRNGASSLGVASLSVLLMVWVGTIVNKLYGC